MGVKEIGQGLKTNLSTIDGLRVFAPDEISEKVPQTPLFVILPGEVKYHDTHDEAYECNFRGLLLLAKQDQPSALSKLIDYIELTGSKSVKAAIEADRTLGGVANDVIVKNSSGAGYTTWGDTKYISTEFEIFAIGGN